MNKIKYAIGFVLVAGLATAGYFSLAPHKAADETRALKLVKPDVPSHEQRIALVIGNSDYRTSPLKNPVNDAEDMAAKLRQLGFEVIERSNLQTQQIGKTLSEFRNKLSPGAVALVFYAGHGLQINGINYLPAVDADINSEEDVANQSLSVNQIMDVLDKAKTRLNLVFLDACRNNPYAARSFRSAEKGLARVTAPSGTLISYATKPGSIAADGSERNGLYTSKLLAEMGSNQPIELVLKRVVGAVKNASQGNQEPWMEGSIEGDFCFAGCQNSAAAPAMLAVSAPSAGDLKLEDIQNNQVVRLRWEKWQAAMKSDFDKVAALHLAADLQTAAWQRFLSTYSQDNPFSSEDEALRTEANSRKQSAPLVSSSENLTPEQEFAVELAKAGDAKAQQRVGYAYDTGLGVTRNYAKAMEWYLKAAALGDVRAQVSIANLYYEGHGVKKIDSKMIEWWLKAANNGDPESQETIAA